MTIQSKLEMNKQYDTNYNEGGAVRLSHGWHLFGVSGESETYSHLWYNHTVEVLIWTCDWKVYFSYFTTSLKVLADLHSAAELKEAAVKFVVEHSEEFVDQVDIASFFFFLFLPLPIKVDKFKPYPDLMAELFKAMARSPPTKRRKWRIVEHILRLCICFPRRPRVL